MKSKLVSRTKRQHASLVVSNNDALRDGVLSADKLDQAFLYSELSKSRTVARAWVGTVQVYQQRDNAALFAQAALRSYATETAVGVQLSDPFSRPAGKLDSTGRELAAAFGRLIAKLDTTEALHQVTSLYTSLLPAGERSERGAFYTPPPLARRLVELAAEAGIDWKTAKVLDPACGGGVLLNQAALRMMAELEGSEPAFALAHLGNRLSGLELDPHAATLAQQAFEILVHPLSAASGKTAPKIVRVGDTLAVEPSEMFDLVVGNPPYGRVSLSAEQRQRFARGLYGHANLYGVFTDIALRWTKPGGCVAYLTPTSVLGGQYYAALRRLLAEEAPPAAIDFVHARKGVFEDVLQETLLALYTKGGEPRRFQVHYLRLTDEREIKITRNGTVALPSDPSDPWLAPRDPEHAALIAHVESMQARLADWGYEVSTGPLVWNRFKPQLKEKPGRNTYPLVWAESVTADGRFVFRALKRNHAPYFKLEVGDAWLRVIEPCVLVQRTTAKEQTRRLIAAAMPAGFVAEHGGVVVENHLNMVRPVGGPRVSPEAVAAVLNSEAVDQVFRCISGSVAVSAFELEAIPLPSVAQMKVIEDLVRRKATRAKVEAAINAMYKGEDA